MVSGRGVKEDRYFAKRQHVAPRVDSLQQCHRRHGRYFPEPTRTIQRCDPDALSPSDVVVVVAPRSQPIDKRVLTLGREFVDGETPEEPLPQAYGNARLLRTG